MAPTKHNRKPDLLERAWSDQRCHFYAELTDPSTGFAEKRLLGILLKDEHFWRKRGLTRPEFVSNLSPRTRRAVLWLFAGAIILTLKKEGVGDWHGPPALIVHRLHGMGEAGHRMLGRLRAYKKDIKSMNLSHLHMGESGAIDELLDDALAALWKFTRRALYYLSKTGYTAFDKEEFVSPFWPFEPPALAYALARLYREHSSPKIRAKDAYARIGLFENEYLNAHLLDPYEAVRIQVRKFKNSPQCPDVDRIVERLLTEKWFQDLPPDNRKPQNATRRTKLT